MNSDPFAPTKKLLGYSQKTTDVKQNGVDIPTDFVDYNKLIGLPKHARTGEQIGLTPYQLDFWNRIEASTKHKFHINKGRQMGFSELVLRILSFRGFNKYAGKSCKIIAGTRSTTTKKLMSRLKAFYRNIPDVVENNGDNMYLELKNGTSFEGLPANPEAITGDTKIAAIAMDESAKWDLTDDTPVLNSIMPIVNTNGSDLFMFSTPKGPRGFFYHTQDPPRDESYEYFTYNIWDTLDNLYTKSEIDEMLADTTMDTDQEYLNKFTTGRSSIFGDDFHTEEFEAGW